MMVVSGSPPSAVPHTLRSRMAWRSAASVLKSSAEAESSMIRICGEPTRARAMVRRWRWPPLKFLPPASTGASKPCGLLRTNSLACAISSAAHSSSSVAASSRQVRLLRMVPLTSDARCGTVATTRRSWSSGQVRTSAPITLTLPVLASYRRGISETSVDFPLPVPPIMPSVLPSGSSRVTSLTALAAPAPNEKLAWSKLSAGTGTAPPASSLGLGSATG